MFENYFRNDEYGRGFYLEAEDSFSVVPYKVGRSELGGFVFDVVETVENDVLAIKLRIDKTDRAPAVRLGMRLGIDCYMDRFPEWNDKFFPTALRCEKNGFWSCFVSPLGKMLSVCSPSKIVSWKNEYSSASYDIVGHRIYTSSIDFTNSYPQPERHPENPAVFPIEIKLFFSLCDSEEGVFDFIEKYAGIHIPKISKYTLEKGETLYIDSQKHDNLKDGVNLIKAEGAAEVSVFVRKDWFYYLDAARKSAEACQQKPGTHCEAWYGYFSRVLYAKEIQDEKYSKKLCEEFDAFSQELIENKDGVWRMQSDCDPYRLQNVSSLLSLLADFYELVGDGQYLEKANDLADFLMSLQAEDGSYRNHNVHYTCVIYPAKSMIELAKVEKKAGYVERATLHYQSAYKAIKNLELLLDNIQTEGQMTFEDGMISCEALQLAYLALEVEDELEKRSLTEAAKLVLRKHLCLEQQFVPDCRVRGCTLRFWEARYDINFFSNMINAPHGWTSWKNYATYYLYLLTGEFDYLRDTMDTLGACMQSIDQNGVLHWGYVVDPCVVGTRLKKGCSIDNIEVEKVAVGEGYLEMLSDWWRQNRKPKYQYLHPWNAPEKWGAFAGASCDNDVHEHFKCLCETVFGKAFVHETDYGFETYNCRFESGRFVCGDEHLKQFIVFAQKEQTLALNSRIFEVKKGFNFIDF